jgi:cyclic beta-1,2-glucan synthetase
VIKLKIRHTLVQLRRRFADHAPTDRAIGDEPPLRAELFSAVQMEQHGRVLAESHQLMSGHPPDRLLARLNDNETILVDVCRLLMGAIAEGRRIAPAGARSGRWTGASSWRP